MRRKQLTVDFSPTRIFSPSGDGLVADSHSHNSKMASWKKLPFPVEKSKIGKNTVGTIREVPYGAHID
jgi:hypothetical protein